MKAIQDYLNDARGPRPGNESASGSPITDVELEVLAQTWSEHCKHKIFNARIRLRGRRRDATQTIDSLFKTYIRGATRARSRRRGRLAASRVFNDNAGRHPLQRRLQPRLQGRDAQLARRRSTPTAARITGIVGVNRDPIGTGHGRASCIFNTDVLCFGSPVLRRRRCPPRPAAPAPDPRRRAPRASSDGGNQSGIPTVSGCDRLRRALPRQAAGLLRHRRASCPREVDGRAVADEGGPARRPHRHGRAAASARTASTARPSPPRSCTRARPSPAVQIGDPITQKKMTDFLLEARDRGPLPRHHRQRRRRPVLLGRRDGAALAAAAELDLTSAPLKYAGLQPWEILLSEAQERMTLAVPPEQARRVPRAGAAARRGGHGARPLHRHAARSTSATAARPWPASTWTSSTTACPPMTLEARVDAARSIAEPALPRAGDLTARRCRRCSRRLNICSQGISRAPVRPRGPGRHA